MPEKQNAHANNAIKPIVFIKIASTHVKTPNIRKLDFLKHREMIITQSATICASYQRKSARTNKVTQSYTELQIEVRRSFFSVRLCE